MATTSRTSCPRPLPKRQRLCAAARAPASRLVCAASSQQSEVCRAQVGEHVRAEVTVVGAGAAGLAAAYFAAVSGAQVRVLEKMPEAGKKILISGGTRCNVLPGDVDIQRDFITESSASALRAVFSTWSLDDCHYWLSDPAQVGIRLTLEQDTNKWFPASNSAAEVRDRLVRACTMLGVTFAYGAGLQDLQPLGGSGSGDGSSSSSSGGGGGGSSTGWELLLSDGRREAAGRVILATGGLSFPVLGATGDGWRLLQRHGHELHEPYPALTPLKGEHPGGEQLAGISLYSAQLSAGGGGKKKRGGGGGDRAQRSAMLFTHRGYSGPAILDLSHHAVRALDRQQPPPTISVQWTPADAATWDARLREGGAALVPNLLRREGLPQRLADALCVEAGVPADRKLSELRKAEREALVAALASYPLRISGHEGYAKAEVTAGGVPLNQLDCSSLESRRLPGVYVCGELCDVAGRIGGFNFAWAWWSGRLAGLAAAEAAAASGGMR